MSAEKIRVTIDVFSGRENPVIEFSGKSLATFKERVGPERLYKLDEVQKLPFPPLGYRGMVIETVGKRQKGLPSRFRVAGGRGYSPDSIFDVIDSELEDFVCGSIPKEFPIEDIKHKIMEFRDWYLRWEDFIGHVGRVDPVIPCPCGPLYEPDWWNASARRPYNNCYNYACNYLTNSFAQPGRATGHMYSALNCDQVKAGAVSDGLIDTPGADNQCPSEGHLVALVIWPGVDFHWYRKGRDGMWSHKPGGTNATNLDNSGHTIVDPRTADRGGYTTFCTFMNVRHGHIMLK